MHSDSFLDMVLNASNCDIYGRSHAIVQALDEVSPAFHGQLLALWVRRKPMSDWKRGALSMLLLPFIRRLHLSDGPFALFKESQMVTGLYGTALK